jgi:hypothetical protein
MAIRIHRKCVHRHDFLTANGAVAKIAVHIPGSMKEPHMANPMPEAPNRPRSGLRSLKDNRWPNAPIPSPLSSFVGREREIEAVVDLFKHESRRLVTLSGPAGVGKTRLAIRVALELASGFADGVACVSLAPVADPGLVELVMAQALGGQKVGGRSDSEGPSDTDQATLHDLLTRLNERDTGN